MYASHVEPASDAVRGKLDWSKVTRVMGHRAGVAAR